MKIHEIKREGKSEKGVLVLFVERFMLSWRFDVVNGQQPLLHAAQMILLQAAQPATS